MRVYRNVRREEEARRAEKYRVVRLFKRKYHRNINTEFEEEEEGKRSKR